MVGVGPHDGWPTIWSDFTVEIGPFWRVTFTASDLPQNGITVDLPRAILNLQCASLGQSQCDPS